MFKKFFRPLLFFLATSLLAIFQISAVFVWNGFFSEFSLIQMVIVSFLFFYNIKEALLSCFIFGLWFDLFSFSFFGLETIALLITLFLVYRISLSWLTNRSIYSFLIINLIFIVFYSFIYSSLFSLSSLEVNGFFLWQKHFWQILSFRVIWSLLISLFSFSALSLATKNLRPVFLDKR